MPGDIGLVLPGYNGLVLAVTIGLELVIGLICFVLQQFWVFWSAPTARRFGWAFQVLRVSHRNSILSGVVAAALQISLSACHQFAGEASYA